MIIACVGCKESVFARFLALQKMRTSIAYGVGNNVPCPATGCTDSIGSRPILFAYVYRRRAAAAASLFLLQRESSSPLLLSRWSRCRPLPEPVAPHLSPSVRPSVRSSAMEGGNDRGRASKRAAARLTTVDGGNWSARSNHRSNGRRRVHIMDGKRLHDASAKI
jgi:hypothetical protein